MSASSVVTKISTRSVLSTSVVLLASVPLIYVIINSGQLSFGQWASLWTARLPELLLNTLSLAILVAIGSFALGVSSAWLITRREFVGRRAAIWLMILPLTIPTYVFAHIYTTLTERDGWLGMLWSAIFGPDVPNPELYNVFGAAFVLSIAGFSYVFLLVSDALTRSRIDIEEAAQLHGLTPRQVFRKISLPMLRPAIAAGLALVVLHVLSDFGAVSMLRYQTFTLSIYLQMSGRFDLQAAAGLSLVLVFLSLTFLILERFFRDRQRYYSAAQAQRHKRRSASKTEQVLIWSWLGLITTFAFALPVAWMLVWSWEAWQESLISEEFWGYVQNSLLISVAAATLATVAAFPVALFHARMRNRISQSYLHLASIGFVLPGPVIALGILSFVLSMLPWIYGTIFVLVLAMLIRFLPLAVQAQEASVQQLSPSIEEAGRSLGARPLENLTRVVIPVLRTGLVSAWVLVFIDTLKELPATLLLRPTGFDTLPVRIWIEASEEMLELAAPSALMLMLGTLPVIWFLMRQHDATTK